jgi:hypothetical protein
MVANKEEARSYWRYPTATTPVEANGGSRVEPQQPARHAPAHVRFFAWRNAVWWWCKHRLMAHVKSVRRTASPRIASQGGVGIGWSWGRASNRLWVCAPEYARYIGWHFFTHCHHAYYYAVC